MGSLHGGGWRQDQHFTRLLFRGRKCRPKMHPFSWLVMLGCYFPDRFSSQAEVGNPSWLWYFLLWYQTELFVLMPCYFSENCKYTAYFSNTKWSSHNWCLNKNRHGYWIAYRHETTINTFYNSYFKKSESRGHLTRAHKCVCVRLEYSFIASGAHSERKEKKEEEGSFEILFVNSI